MDPLSLRTLCPCLSFHFCQEPERASRAICSEFVYQMSTLPVE